MTYQTLEEKIGEVLKSTTLKKSERSLLLQTYLQPGISAASLEADKSMIERLSQEGLLLKNARSRTIYPIPIALLFKKYADQRKSGYMKEPPALKSLDQWIKYPLMRSAKTKLKSSKEHDTVLKWLFELHAAEWNRVYCFGDYESFIDAIGVETEQDWINERMKKQRCASVVATQDGKWAQHIRKVSTRELRECLIDPKDFTDMFIMAFPDIHTTVIGSSENEVTFIHSDTVAKTYSELVERCLVK